MTFSRETAFNSILVILIVAVLAFFGYQLILRAGLVRETVTIQSVGAVTGESPLAPPREFDIVTILGKDGIPAILDPNFVSAQDAQRFMSPTEQVIGVSINGESRAYATAQLSAHEIVNDVVGGVPVAVTW